MTRLAAQAKMQYYPTPLEVVRLLATHITTPVPPGIRLLDICVGKGEAVAELARLIGTDQTYGVELNTQRARQAQTQTTRTIHASYNELHAPTNGFQILFLNPPYDQEDGGRRMELSFLQHATEKGWLQAQGLLVWIVPEATARTERASKYLPCWFANLTMYRFPGELYDTFKQVVVLGTQRPKRSASEPWIPPATPTTLDGNPTTQWPAPAPQALRRFYFYSATLDLEELQATAAGAITAFPELQARPQPLEARVRPLLPLRRGHLAMYLGAGMVNNTTLQDDHNTLIVKGRTTKVVDERTEHLENGDTRTIQTQRLQSRIRTLDLASGEITTLQGEKELKPFFEHWIEILAQAVQERFQPLYSFTPPPELVPIFAGLSKDRPLPGRTETGLFAAQAHTAAAIYMLFEKLHEKFSVMVGEMGVGKTTTGLGVAAGLHHAKQIAAGHPAPFLVLVMAPTLVCEKWARETREIWPGVQAAIVSSVAELAAFVKHAQRHPGVPHVAIVSKEMAKLGPGWEPAYQTRYSAHGRLFPLPTDSVPTWFPSGPNTGEWVVTRRAASMPRMPSAAEQVSKELQQRAGRDDPRVTVGPAEQGPAPAAIPSMTSNVGRMPNAGRQLSMNWGNLATLTQPAPTPAPVATAICPDPLPTVVPTPLASPAPSPLHNPFPGCPQHLRVISADELSARFTKASDRLEAARERLNTTHRAQYEQQCQLRRSKQEAAQHRREQARAQQPASQRSRYYYNQPAVDDEDDLDEPVLPPPIWEELRCSECGAELIDNDRTPLRNPDWLQQKPRYCQAPRGEHPTRQPKEKERRGKKSAVVPCGAALWQYSRRYEKQGNPRWPIADYAAHVLPPSTIDLFISDEVHQNKAQSTDQAYAFGNLVQAARHTLALTGTIFGGVASSLFYLWFRLGDPQVRGRYHWDEVERWIEDYGVLETVIDDKDDERGAGRFTANKRTTRHTREVPGVSPALVPLLLNNTIFMRLQDLGYKLPPYREIPILLDMRPEQATDYQLLDSTLQAEIRQNLRLISAWLQSTLARPNSCWREEIVTDPEGNPIYSAAALPADILYPKEEWLLAHCLEQQAQNRKVLTYLRETGTRDIQPRLARFLEEAGLRVRVLRSSVDARQREAWIRREAPHCDVLLCHPKLVEVGLDLIEFPDIVFYEIEYSLYTLMQAARRTWRLGQTRDVTVHWLAYRNTMEHRAIALIGQKIGAASLVYGDEAAAALAEQAGASRSLLHELAQQVIQSANIPDLSDLFEQANSSPDWLAATSLDGSITMWSQDTAAPPLIVPEQTALTIPTAAPLTLSPSAPAPPPPPPPPPAITITIAPPPPTGTAQLAFFGLLNEEGSDTLLAWVDPALIPTHRRRR